MRIANISRAASRLLALTGMLGALIVGIPGTAQAAASPCPGTKIDSQWLPYGAIELYYSNGYNCVIARHNLKDSTVKRAMQASIRLSSSDTWITDEGVYNYYAGPVTIYAAGKCIDWGGGVLLQYTWTYDDHCG
jgi:hypothetical protein